MVGGVTMKRYVIVGVLFLVLAVIGGCAQQQESTPGVYIDVSPAEAKELIDNTPDLIIIDVSPHYANGHLPGAVHYYLGDGSLDRAIPTLDKSKTYLVYCHYHSDNCRRHAEY